MAEKNYAIWRYLVAFVIIIFCFIRVVLAKKKYGPLRKRKKN